MNKASFAISILTCIILGGCYTSYQNVASPSPKPEIIMNTADRAKIKSEVINYYLDLAANYSIVSESDHTIVFSTPEEQFGNAVYQAVTGDYNSTHRISIRINMATIDNSTSVKLILI